MFKGGNINQLMKMAKQLQAQAARMKEEVEKREFIGTAGGGAVKVVARGTGELVSVEIAPELLESNDREMLQDLILTAANQALKEARETMARELEKITGGLGIDMGGLF
ncbi:MAG: YbaB/EbfC family nucleoid-associated protein [Thermovibrio sp.]|nr:MAG: YbaB/EbfC family nucleoid-associated protein [Thermovibrio sp.]